MAASALTTLSCSRCSRSYDAERVQQLCECGAPLLARYDLAAAAKTLTRDAFDRRAPDLWRFRELLPVRRDDVIVSLDERPTPLIALRRIGDEVGVAELVCKDEGTLPTGSFKARGAAIGVSRARELGVRAFAMPTNGNAGTAWAAYAARAGMRAIVAMPALAPRIHRQRCALAGARVVIVDGLITDAGRVIARAVASSGVYDASTLKEPYRIEGKKTLGFEIAEQFAWDLPDVIVYPTGGGVGLIGMHKAFRELQAIGLLGPRMPRFFAVQSSGCAPIVKAWNERRDTSVPWDGAQTVAFGINVPKAIGDFMVLAILKESRGHAIAVDDSRIVEYQHKLIELGGVRACLEGGAALAAVAQAVENGILSARDRVLIINTGEGALGDGQTPATAASQTDLPSTASFTTIGPDDELRITSND